MDKYEFNLFGGETYSFIYDDFCSNYIELAKFNSSSNTTKSVLCYVLTGISKLLHPFMPFVTEEIYQMLPIKDSESIMISEYPKYNKKFDFDMSPDDEKEVSEMCNVSRGVYDKGMDRGMALGMDKGIDKSTLNSISKMMSTFNITIDRAMDILEVPDEKREYYKSQISSD